MSEQQHEKILTTIRALLAKAEATKFPEEAKEFTRKANELMIKWAIDDAVLKHGTKAALEGIGKSSIFVDANEYRGPKSSLLNTLAQMHDCRAVKFPQRYEFTNGTRKRVFEMVIVGHEADREFVIALFTSLLVQAEIEFLSDKVQRDLRRDCAEGGHSIRWRNSFMFAFGREIYSRLGDIKSRLHAEAAATQAAAGATSFALVVADKKALVENKFKEFFPRVSQSKAKPHSGFEAARQHGRTAGQRADIGLEKIGRQASPRLK